MCSKFGWKTLPVFDIHKKLSQITDGVHLIWLSMKERLWALTFLMLKIRRSVEFHSSWLNIVQGKNGIVIEPLIWLGKSEMNCFFFYSVDATEEREAELWEGSRQKWRTDEAQTVLSTNASSFLFVETREKISRDSFVQFKLFVAF